MTTAPVTNQRYNSIPLGQIDISKTNPRKHFDPKKLEELAASIERLGVLEPILVRPVGSRFELVAGERRFRASQLAKLPIIPAIVRELDDKTALEVQVVENLQREDLHPLEEAEGYQLLIKSHGYDADSLALKIGKSRSYIYGRMKLSDLCEQAKKALWDGKISHSVALLIARIPDAKLQTEATRAITGQEMSYRRVEEYIHREFMLSLSGAPWKKDDPTLVAAAGPCTSCPFRTGNQKELFGDVKSADVCTKPSCFKSKQNAHWQRLQVEAKSKGLRILPASEEKAVFQYGRFSSYSAPYVEADAKYSYDAKKSYRQVLGSKCPQITVARNPETGEIHELIPRKVAKDALLSAGVVKKEASFGSNDQYRQKQKVEAEKRKLERAIENAIIADLQPKLAKVKLSTPLLRIVTKSIAFSKASYGMEELFKRRGLKYPTWDGRERAIAKFVDGLTDGEMALVCAELTLTFGNLEARSNAEKDLVRQLAKLVGVNDSAIGKKFRAEAAAKKREKAAKAKKKKKPAKRGAKVATAPADAEDPEETA